MVDLRMKESSRNLYAIFSMDCERIANESPEGGGPRSWEIGGEAISRFSEILSNEGFRAVFFIQPEAAERYAGLFLKLKDKGFELGLHIHPGNFRDHSFKKHLGSYSPDEQRHILSLAISDWRKALGFEPKSFRAGFFSANDYTYKILYELGFRQSSTSKPDRNLPEVHASWVGAYPYGHHVNPNNRLIPGTLELYEVPISVNSQKRRTSGDPLDLRIEATCTLEDHEETIDLNIKKMLELNIPAKSIVTITHNTESFLYNQSVLKFIISHLRRTATKHDLKIVSITLEELHNVVCEFK